MADFTSNWRQQQSIAAQPLQDELYRAYLMARMITRPQTEDDPNFELDLLIGVDASIRIPGGMTLTVQEKTLSYDYASYNSISVEYWQNSATQEPGDWFNCRADLYFVGYLSKQGNSYDKWALLSWTAVKLAHCRLINRPIWKESQNSNDGARASFRYIEANSLYRICPEAFVAQFNMLKPHYSDELEIRRARALTCED